MTILMQWHLFHCLSITVRKMDCVPDSVYSRVCMHIWNTLSAMDADVFVKRGWNTCLHYRSGTLFVCVHVEQLSSF